MAQNPLAAFVAQNPGLSLVALKVDASGALKVVQAESPTVTLTPVQNASGNVAAASAVATLPAATGKTTYLTGFSLTGGGATAASFVLATVTGLLGGTQTYVFAVPVGATLGATPLNVTFSPPLPASAVNTAVVVTLPSLGSGNTNAAAVAWGYQL